MSLYTLPTSIKICWIVTEGMAGTENQCLGVADALGILPDVKKIQPRQPWKTLSPYIGWEQGWSFDPPLMPPWPDLLIASGRKSIAASRYIKKASGGKTFTVQIQDPRIHPRHFDLVAVAAHDRMRGDNVIVTTAAPNRITPEKLAAGRARFSWLEKIKSPRVAVLIGGDSRAHRLTDDIVMKLVRDLKNLDAGLMVTASRRTTDRHKKMLVDNLSGHNAYIWDGNGDNPYIGFLSWADCILVTEDSVSMLSDAATTGKPVYVIGMEGGGIRLDRFHENLTQKRITRPFDGKLERWDYEPLNDAQVVAGVIAGRFG